jgi:hypothetical protein
MPNETIQEVAVLQQPAHLEEQQRDAPPSSAHEQPSASCSVRCFSEVTPSDGRLDFQIIDLGRQLYVWVAVGGAKMSNLSFSIQAPQVRSAERRVASSTLRTACTVMLGESAAAVWYRSRCSLHVAAAKSTRAPSPHSTCALRRAGRRRRRC